MTAEKLTGTSMCARIFDVSIGYPGEHLLALRQHLLSGRVDVGKHLNRDSRIADERRYLLYNPLVFLQLFSLSKFVADTIRR